MEFPDQTWVKDPNVIALVDFTRKHARALRREKKSTSRSSVPPPRGLPVPSAYPTDTNAPSPT
jgi:hypothetical protein